MLRGMKFRETLWFKKGELDAAAAQTAAPDEPAAVDLLPVEDRYNDDGSISSGDTESFGLHSGQTQGIATLRATGGIARVPERDAVRALVGDLKRGRGPVMMAIAASLVAVVAIVLMFAR